MIDISLRVSLARATVLPPVEPARRLLWVAHDDYRFNFDDRLRQHSQGWAYNPAGNGPVRQIVTEKQMSRPEVYRVEPQHSFRMTAPWLDLLAGINPELDPDDALSVLHRAVCYCNTQTNLLDQIRICGGATIEELRREGSRVYFRTILTKDAEGNALPPPLAADVLADRALWHWVTGIQPDSDINYVRRWNRAHTEKLPVRMLNISSVPVYFRADELLPVTDFKDPQWKPVGG
jgi:hypothetical protein